MSDSSPGGIDRDEEDRRTETVSARLSRAEKRDVELVAAMHDSSVSALLWGRGLADILGEAERIKASYKGAVAAA